MNYTEIKKILIQQTPGHKRKAVEKKLSEIASVENINFPVENKNDQEKILISLQIILEEKYRLRLQKKRYWLGIDQDLKREYLNFNQEYIDFFQLLFSEKDDFKKVTYSPLIYWLNVFNRLYLSFFYFSKYRILNEYYILNNQNDKMESHLKLEFFLTNLIYRTRLIISFLLICILSVMGIYFMNSSLYRDKLHQQISEGISSESMFIAEKILDKKL